MSPKHSNTDVGWIKRKFASIDKQLRELSAAKKLQASTIGKGGLTVKDGGQIKTLYPNGKDGIRMGTRYEGPDPVGTFFQLVREDGILNTFYMERLQASVALPDGYSDIQFNFDSAVMAVENLALGGSGYTIAGGPTGMALGPIVQIQHATTGASANAYLDPADNRVWRSTSSRRYKQDIEDAAVDVADVLALRPRTWRDKGEVAKDPNTERRYVGLIAEEVDEFPSLRQFVSRKDGEAEAVDYDRLSSVALLAVVKDLAARVADLEAGT